MGLLEDKVALVTGGGSGLGAATARALTAEGAMVVVADFDEEGGRAVADEVAGRFVHCDVSSLQANKDAVAFAVAECGGLDLIHLNAGVSSGMGIGDDFDEARYRTVMGANLDGVVFGAVAALPAMRGREGAAMVATASLAGLTAVPFDPLYAANKHAVVGLARSLGGMTQNDGVRFNAVCPGFAESKIIAPFREQLVEGGMPIIPAERVAETVLHLFTGTMSGECWFVQAGREAAPFNFRNIPGPKADE